MKFNNTALYYYHLSRLGQGQGWIVFVYEESSCQNITVHFASRAYVFGTSNYTTLPLSYILLIKLSLLLFVCVCVFYKRRACITNDTHILEKAAHEQVAVVSTRNANLLTRLLNKSVPNDQLITRNWLHSIFSEYCERLPFFLFPCSVISLKLSQFGCWILRKKH